MVDPDISLLFLAQRRLFERAIFPRSSITTTRRVTRLPACPERIRSGDLVLGTCGAEAGGLPG